MKFDFYKMPYFSLTEHQTEKLGKAHRWNILRGLHLTYYPIWSRGCGEMASDEWTDKAATICPPFEKHNNADQDLTAQNVHYDLGPTLSDKGRFSSKK